MTDEKLTRRLDEAIKRGEITDEEARRIYRQEAREEDDDEEN